MSPGDETWAARPLDPIDFEVRPEIPFSGWPFDRAHLDRWYARAQTLCMTTEDYRRAFNAFAAKEKPVFEGN